MPNLSESDNIIARIANATDANSISPIMVSDVMASHSASLKALSDDINEVRIFPSEIAAECNSMSTRLRSDEEQIAANNTQISLNQSQIATNTEAIAANDNKLSSMTERIDVIGTIVGANSSKLVDIEPFANRYVHPASHPATMIDEDATHRFVSDTEKSRWNDRKLLHFDYIVDNLDFYTQCVSTQNYIYDDYVAYVKPNVHGNRYGYFICGGDVDASCYNQHISHENVDVARSGRIYVNRQSGAFYLVENEDLARLSTEKPQPEYFIPTGSAKPEVYLQQVSTTGANMDIDIRFSAHPGNVYTLLEQSVHVSPGQTFRLSLNANSLGGTGTVREDMRYCCAYMYTEWHGNRIFDLQKSWGHLHPTDNVNGNYSTVMSISENVTVPVGVKPGDYRIRVIYNNAWSGTASADSQSLDGAIAYDIPVRVG